MNRLSVAIITHNEAKRIRPCLESVKWADEIVVVDSLSTDETVKICHEYTPLVFSQPWLGYGEQKNLALSKVRHDWVLSLDADERVTPKLREEIYGILLGNSRFSGYYVPRKSYFLGRWIRYCGWYPDYNLRLFRRGEGIFKERMVHECVELKGDIGYLTGDLEHETYRSLEEYLERMQRYSTLAALEMHRGGRRFRWLDLCIRPLGTFWKMFLLRQGFREGVDVLILSGLFDYYKFVKYAKLAEIERGNAE